MSAVCGVHSHDHTVAEDRQRKQRAVGRYLTPDEGSQQQQGRSPEHGFLNDRSDPAHNTADQQRCT
jgi:hypothetical protein